MKKIILKTVNYFVISIIILTSNQSLIGMDNSCKKIKKSLSLSDITTIKFRSLTETNTETDIDYDFLSRVTNLSLIEPSEDFDEEDLRCSSCPATLNSNTFSLSALPYAELIFSESCLEEQHCLLEEFLDQDSSSDLSLSEEFSNTDSSSPRHFTTPCSEMQNYKRVSFDASKNTSHEAPTNLSYADLSEAFSEDTDFPRIHKIFKPFLDSRDTIKHIILDENNLGTNPTNLIFIVQKLPLFINLSYLELKSNYLNSLSNCFLIILCNILTKCEKLQSVDFSNNELDDNKRELIEAKLNKKMVTIFEDENSEDENSNAF